MANFAEITLTNTNLTGETNFFTVKVKECSSPSFITVQTGLTYEDFPYLVNLDETIGEITCYEYNVSETLTNLVCSGITYIGTPSVTPTPTNTSTPTPTNTSTPTPSVTTSVTGVTVTPTPTNTSTPTPSVTTSVTGVTVTPTPTNTSTPSVTPSITITPTPSSTPPQCYSFSVFTGSSFNDVCSSSEIITVYTNDGSNLFNGSIVYIDNCPIQGGSISLPENIYISKTGSTSVYESITSGTVFFAGNCEIPTPSVTPTISITPSVTPSVTPSPSYTGITVEFGATYESGSTVANYSFTASTRVSQDTTINFTNVLSKTDDTPVLIVSAVTINSGQSVGESTVRNSTKYDDIRGYQSSFTGVTYSGDLIGKTNNNKSINFISKSTPIHQQWIFRACCANSSPQTIEVEVDGDAVAPGGWVNSGFGVYLYDNCYTPYLPGGDGSDGVMYGPDFKLCSISQCLCPSNTPTPTPTITPTPSSVNFNHYKLISCCDDTVLQYVSLQSLTNIQIGDIIPYQGECWGVAAITPALSASTSISGSFSSCTQCQLVQSCPSVTPTPTPSITPSVDPCVNGLDCILSANTECELSCYTALVPYVPKRALNCCDPSDSFGVMVPESMEVGTIIYWNNECWYIGAPTTENENYILSFSEYDTCNECVGCNGISPCELSWITCKVDPCCDGAPQLPQGSITFEGTACVGDGIVYNGICYTITNIVDGQGIGSLVVTQDDIVEDICENPQCSCTVTLRACADVLGLGNIHYFSNFIRVNSWIITDNYSIGDVIQFNTNLLTGNDDLGYSYPENMKVCYTVVENDDTVPLNTQFIYDDNLGQQNCEDLYLQSNSKCYIFVGLRPCHGIQTAQNSIIIFILPSQNIWSTLSPGDTISSVELLGNPYISQGYVGVGATPCYTILEPGTEITLPQVQVGNIYGTDPSIDISPILQPDCSQDICSECFNGVVVTNTDDGLQNPITIQYYVCSETYPYQYAETQTINYGNSVTLSCINLSSLYMINHQNIVNQNITINYSSMNNC